MAPSIPSDLDAFWQKTLARLRSRPLEVQVEKLDQRLPYYVHRLTYRGLDDIPVRAYLSLPVNTVHRGRVPRPLPAIVGGPGYGGWEFGHQLNECQRGYAVVQVYPRSQGESGELWSVDKSAVRAWVNHGKNSPEGFFYQGAYTDLVRCIDYLVTRPDIDPERIGVMGTSQGGMLALGTAAIDARVRAVVAHVPYLCNFPQNSAPPCADLVKDEAFVNTWRYFDPVCLAHRIQAPALLSAGGKDTTCLASSIRAVYDRITGIKALAEYPDLIHTSSNDFYSMSWEWMERYLH